MPRLFRLRVCSAAIIAAGAALAGCAARATPVGYAELHYGSTYRFYPHTYYDGRDVYYIDGRWMYQDGTVWRYYESEPATLYRYRSTIRQAPPAPRYPEPRGRYYPAQPVPTPAPQAAPPPSPAPPSSPAPPPTQVR